MAPKRVPTRLRKLRPRRELERVNVGVRTAVDLPSLVSLAPAYPGYFLVKEQYEQIIHGAGGRRFRYWYTIKRKLRGRNRGPRIWDQRGVRIEPNLDKRTKRWQLEVRMYVGYVRTPYHRVLGLAVHPCTQDHKGYEVDPYWVVNGGLTKGLYDGFWEVHHGDWDTCDNTPWNLWVLWHSVHRALRKPKP